MPKSPELPSQANVRLDQSTFLIMRRAKDILGLPSTNHVYKLAVDEFIANHPEITDGLIESLRGEEQVVLGAIEKLTQLRQPGTATS